MGQVKGANPCVCSKNKLQGVFEIPNGNASRHLPNRCLNASAAALVLSTASLISPATLLVTTTVDGTALAWLLTVFTVVGAVVVIACLAAGAVTGAAAGVAAVAATIGFGLAAGATKAAGCPPAVPGFPTPARRVATLVSD